MFDQNMALVDGFQASNYGLAHLDLLTLDKEIPMERKPVLTKVTWKDGITDNHLYYRGSGVLAVVKVKEDSPSISQEKVAAAGGMLPVDPINLTVRTWRTDKHELRVSAKAEKLILASGSSSTPVK